MSLRRILPAALFGAAVALGGSTLGYPAIASATWDIEKYDECVGEITHDEDFTDALHFCCYRSGGVWNADIQECQAPPAERTRAPVRPPTGEPPTPVIGLIVPGQSPTAG
jgi:hypothetical protein